MKGYTTQEEQITKNAMFVFVSIAGEAPASEDKKEVKEETESKEEKPAEK